MVDNYAEKPLLVKLCIRFDGLFFPMSEASKKKGLPQWLRDALNKKEKEKQKQIEKEKPKIQSDGESDDEKNDLQHDRRQDIESAAKKV